MESDLNILLCDMQEAWRPSSEWVVKSWWMDPKCSHLRACMVTTGCSGHHRATWRRDVNPGGDETMAISEEACIAISYLKELLEVMGEGIRGFGTLSLVMPAHAAIHQLIDDWRAAPNGPDDGSPLAKIRGAMVRVWDGPARDIWVNQFGRKAKVARHVGKALGFATLLNPVNKASNLSGQVSYGDVVKELRLWTGIRLSVRTMRPCEGRFGIKGDLRVTSVGACSKMGFLRTLTIFSEIHLTTMDSASPGTSICWLGGRLTPTGFRCYRCALSNF
jgi:hypothetical protein